jgi:hypothetical protein
VQDWTPLYLASLRDLVLPQLPRGNTAFTQAVE